MRSVLIAFVVAGLAAPALAQTGTVPTPVPYTLAPGAVAVPNEAGQPVLFELKTLRDLVAICGTPESDPNYAGAIGLCVGFGTGVIDYHLLDTSGRNVRARRVCLPNPPPSRGEGRRQFVAWAQSNAQYMDEPATNGLMRFLIAAFPCRK